MAQLAAGNRAPAFTLTDQHGKKVKLSDFKGKKVVVYFYPKADTPGCTTQSCALRDAEPDLKKLKAVVLGISPDTPEKQAKFDDKYGLGFPLLADTDHAVAEKYGVWGEKVELRPQVHGHHPLRVRRRREGQARRRLLQGQPQGHRSQGHQGARRTRVRRPAAVRAGILERPCSDPGDADSCSAMSAPRTASSTAGSSTRSSAGCVAAGAA